MSEWIKELQNNTFAKSEYNLQRDIEFRRLLLSPSPSNAYDDSHYRSAFVNEPIKRWNGEPGVLIIRNFPLIGFETNNANVEKILSSFKVLHEIWMNIKIECALQPCELCTYLKSLEELNSKEDEIEDEDEDEDEGEHGNGNETKSAENPEEKNIKKDQDSKREGKEKEDRKRKRTSGQGHSQALNAEFVTRPIKRLIRGRKIFKKRAEEKEPDWMLTKPYDESIPYWNRYGYTWRNATSSSVMAMFQNYRQPVTQ